MKKVVFLIVLIVFIVAIIIFALNENSKGTLVVNSNQSIDFKESNEILISEETKDIAYDFIKSILKKKQFFDSFDVYLTKEGKSTRGKFLTRIQISKGAFKYFNKFSSEDVLLTKIKIGRAKQFYECINICLSKELIKTKMCSCGAYFMDD
jgi:preprotein translocase subunit SecF